MSTEHDLEYGPTPPGAGYEHTDIDPAIGYHFAVWMGVGMVIAAGIVYGTFALFDGQRVARDEATQQFPLAAGQVREAPLPRLQTQPFKDIYLLELDQDHRLANYGWVDKEIGVVHIPIDRAMELMVSRGLLPARAEGGTADQDVVQDSSAGRTAARR